MLKEQVAVITGAGRGIGAEIAKALAKNHANIAIVDYSEKNAVRDTIAEIESLGVKVKYYQCDVSNYEKTKEVVDSVAKEFGKIDILVNNAGVTADKILLRMEEADWDRVLDINLKGSFNMTKHATVHMMRKKYGRIVNISSVVALMGNVGQANYVASKAGLIGLTKTVAKEFGGKNITVNAIAPGYIKTAMTDALSEDVRNSMLKMVPLGYLGEVKDIANAVLFLVSESARYITGVTLKVDGGMYI